MATKWYSTTKGLDRSVNQPDAYPLSFLKLDNFIPNRVVGSIVKRGGSKVWTHNGDILSLGYYSKEGASFKIPFASIPVRYRLDGATPYIETYDYTSDTWSALTLGSEVSFLSAGIGNMEQVGPLLAICCGLPAKMTAEDSNVTRLGGPGPTTAPTIATNGTGLTGRARYCYTFYDSTSGWESSPSPYTDFLSLTNQGVRVSDLETTCDKEGVDKKRIYRCPVSTGLEPFQRVTEVSLATTSYDDTTADTSLGADAPALGDHEPPPSVSYIVARFADRIWIAYNNELWYSKAYDGSYTSLEYFSWDRREVFSQKITGLAYAPDLGRLFVFQPPGHGIWTISGTSDANFEKEPYTVGPEMGTEFPRSVAVHDKYIAYWGINGPTIKGSGTILGGGEASTVVPMDNYLRDIISRDYTGDIYVWCVWHPVLKQFVFSFAASSTTDVIWGDSGTGSEVKWADPDTGEVIGWGGSGGSTRQIVFAVDPEIKLVETLSWSQVADNNAEGNLFTCAMVPTSKGTGKNIYQETIFLGTLNAGMTIQSLREDLALDDTEEIVAEAITARIDPLVDGANNVGQAASKRYKKIGFQGNVNPFTIGAEVVWCKDIDPLTAPIVTWRTFAGQDSDSLRGFESGLAEWIHLKITDETVRVGKEVLTQFSIAYYPIGYREARDT